MSERVRDQDLPRRLQRLEELLARSTTAPRAGGDVTPEPEDVYLQSVPADRIRLLTAELRLGEGSDIDTVDAATMRLLLDDYVTSVTHLRAVARAAIARLSAVAAPIREARELVTLEQEPVAGERPGDPRPGAPV